MATPAIATPTKPLSDTGVWTLGQVARLVMATRRRFEVAQGHVSECRAPVDPAVFAKLQEAIDTVNDEINRALLAHIDAIDGRP